MEPDIGMIVVWLALWGAVGGAVGASRGTGTAGGVFLGVLLGPIGVIIAAVSKSTAATPAPVTVLDRIERRPAGSGWHPDPLGRFAARWYDGDRWTQHVGRVGVDGTREQLEDPI